MWMCDSDNYIYIQYNAFQQQLKCDRQAEPSIVNNSADNRTARETTTYNNSPLRQSVQIVFWRRWQYICSTVQYILYIYEKCCKN